jgi:hypothetical protein
MSRNVDMCEKLSAQLGISPLFWTKPSWNANGFFGGLSNFAADTDMGIHGESEISIDSSSRWRN